MKPEEFIEKWLGWAKNKEGIKTEILTDLQFMCKLALTIPVVSVPKNEGTLFCQHCESKNVTVGDSGLWCTDCGKLTKRQDNAH